MFKRMLLVLLCLALSSPAFSAGRVLNMLTAPSETFWRQFNAAFLSDPVFVRYDMEGKTVPPVELAGIYSRSFRKCGYDYDKTLYEYFRKFNSESVKLATKNKTAIFNSPLMSVGQSNEPEILLDEIQKKGYILYDTLKVWSDNIYTPYTGKKLNLAQLREDQGTSKQDGTDEYDYQPEIPFGEDGTFCGFVVDHRIHPRELVGLLVLENIEKTKKVTILYDSKDERHLCREVINSNAERGSMMCVDTEERPNNFGLDKIGVHMSTILWGTYCSVPD